MAEGQALPAVGDLLGGGKYRVARLVGSGGMGAVFEAVNLDTTRRVAIKVLRPDLAAKAHVARRFAQEARAACRIEHPNIVGVFDLIQEGATVFIVEEFLDGEDLKQRVTSQGPMGAAEALRAAIPVMEALAFAHSRGVVHRDIKPDNIFLARTPRGVVPKVIDFGIARVVDDDGESLQGTALGEVMGTAYYMSPEQARGDVEQVDGRTDVWSLGAVLYYAASGARPYEAQNRHQLLYRIAHDPPAPLSLHVTALAPEYAELVHRALERDLDRRFATMEAFLEEARACLTALEERTDVVSLPPEANAGEADATIETAPVDVSAVELPSGEASSTTGQRKVPDSTPASWEASAVREPSRRAPHPAWTVLFALAIVLGAVVGVRAAVAPSQVAPRAAARRVAPPSAPVVEVRALTPPPAAPVSPVTPATPEPPRVERARLARSSTPSRATRRLRALPLAPNPYDDAPTRPPRTMPPGLWGPR